MSKRGALLVLGLIGGVVGAKVLYSFSGPRALVFGLGDKLADLVGDDPIVNESSELEFITGRNKDA